MSQQQLLKEVVEALEAAGVAYMLTGSMATSAQGEPRSTHDIDFLVSLPPSAVSVLAARFSEPDYFLDEIAVREALHSGIMFNLLHIPSGNKVDFWLSTSDPFDKSRFRRRRAELVLGLKVFISSPEDTILQKLLWIHRHGGNERHFLDALRVYELQAARLDEEYLTDWGSRLGVSALLQQLRGEARPLKK